MAVWKADYIKSNLQYEWKYLIIHATFIRCGTASVLITLMKDQVKCINWTDWRDSMLTNVWLCWLSTETVPVIYSKTYLEEEEYGAGELGRGSEIWASPPNTLINSQDSETLIKCHGRSKTDAFGESHMATASHRRCLQFLAPMLFSNPLCFVWLWSKHGKFLTAKIFSKQYNDLRKAMVSDFCCSPPRSVLETPPSTRCQPPLPSASLHTVTFPLFWLPIWKLILSSPPGAFPQFSSSGFWDQQVGWPQRLEMSFLQEQPGFWTSTPSFFPFFLSFHALRWIVWVISLCELLPSLLLLWNAGTQRRCVLFPRNAVLLLVSLWCFSGQLSVLVFSLLHPLPPLFLISPLGAPSAPL